MNKVPLSIKVMAALTAGAFIVGFILKNERWIASGGLGTIFTFAAWANWFTKDDPPMDDDFHE